MRSDLRLLLNAEPFGFGPSAAIAAFFPHLRAHFKTIGYMGKGHTLDLQRNLAYDRIHELTDIHEEQQIRDIAKEYDLVLTAMDFSVAEQVKAAGVPIIIYDSLTWYWKEIPAIIKKADLYIAQDFLSVRERIAAHPEQFCRTEIVAPIIKKRPRNVKRTGVIINLGGLRNPLLCIDELVEYAKCVITAALCVQGNERVTIATSDELAKRLRSFGAKSYSHSEVSKILKSSKLAIMTPGLGNIYDAGAYGIPTVWLPPANDSQGQQLALLRQNNLSDAAVDWKDITGHEIDYFAAQKNVMSTISVTIRAVTRDHHARDVLMERMAYACMSAAALETSKAAGFIERFGTGGAQQVAKIVLKKATSKEAV